MKTTLLVFLLFFATIASHAQDKIISKTDSSITFVVDEDLPAPKRTIYQDTRNRYLASSFTNECFSFDDGDALYSCILDAYRDHRPIVLSPDMIWITICQGFARYASTHSEELRSMLVDHEGKMTLSVEIESPLQPETYDWPSAVDLFSALIKENTKNDIVETITSDFSTTDKTCRIASEITLMDCVKEYFDYEVFYAACGIPYVTLTGTADDWRRVLDKTSKLSQFGLKKWVSGLEPVLKQFIKAAEGKPSQHFWRCMVQYIAVDEFRAPGCSPGDDTPTTEVDGWILKFFPDEKGKTKGSVKWTKNMPRNQVCVPFKYKEIDGEGNVTKETDMEFLSGVFGYEVDAATGALTPKIGWAVQYKEDHSLFKF
ncbi:MAG: DUF4419 domain-containing protein [Salinivirgaceae bacterium]|nr:DUF4419 domain-containing protein [Salinivirgaceae bacterium]